MFLGQTTWAAPRIAIRFDPGYVYSFSPDLRKGIEAHLKYWKRQKVSRVVILFNNPAYGAFFKTRIPDQGQESNLGKTQLLQALIPKLHQNHIEVFAWFYPFRSKLAWESNPDWRAPRCTAENEFLLDVKKPEVQLWYRRLVLETLQEFPKLDGVDIAEPISVQNCEITDPERTHRLSRFLQDLAIELKSKHIKLSLTPTWTASKDGKLWTPEMMRDHFGVDLIELLKTIKWDTFFPQLNYKQWQTEYHDSRIFNPNWTGAAFITVRKTLVSRRALQSRIGIHLELGDIENRQFSVMLKRLTAKALRVPYWGIDVYDSHLAIQKQTNLRSELKNDHHQKY